MNPTTSFEHVGGPFDGMVKALPLTYGSRWYIKPQVIEVDNDSNVSIVLRDQKYRIDWRSHKLFYIGEN